MGKDDKLDGVKELISGKEKSYMTYDELSNNLSPDLLVTDRLENVVMFGQVDVDALEQTEELEGPTLENGAADTTEELTESWSYGPHKGSRKNTPQATQWLKSLFCRCPCSGCR